MPNFKIASLAKIMGGVLLFSFVSVLGLGYVTLEHLKVGGPYYQKMVLGKDLLADILPPPLYVIEPFLLASEIIADPEEMQVYRAKIAKVRKDYDERFKYWQKDSIVDADARNAVIVEANREATVFWNVLDNQFYPAMEKGDKSAIHKSFEALKTAYRNQRKAVDKAVELIEAMNKQTGQTAHQEEVQSMTIAGIASLIVLLIAGGSVAAVLLGMVKPIELMKEVMRKLADGSRDVTVPYSDRKNEIGEMAQSVEVFKNNLIETERLRQENEEAEARASEERKQQRLELASSFERAVGAIVNTVAAASTQLGATAEELTRSARHTSEQSSAVASASEVASTNVQAVASAAEELSGAIREISGQVRQSTNMVGKASTEAQKTTEQMQALGEAARRIGGIVELINEIASQTNLLALNATIEAARAGESGRGFAVVSQEVKQLAERTAKATGEIAAQISSIQENTGQAAQSIEGINSTISSINDVSTTIAAAVEEQGTVTMEIARSTHSASNGTDEVTRSIQGVRETAENSSSAAAQVLTAANELSQQSNVLQTEVQNFLENIRAA